MSVDPAASGQHGQEHVAQAQEAAKGIFGPNGWLAQAKEAQASGVFSGFVAQLLATLGPIVGQAILAFIQSLLPAITPPVAPPPAPAAQSKPK